MAEVTTRFRQTVEGRDYRDMVRFERDVISLLEKLSKHHATAHNCYQRYSWRPDTATGQKELERWQKHDKAYDAALKELGVIFGARWAK